MFRRRTQEAIGHWGVGNHLSVYQMLTLGHQIEADEMGIAYSTHGIDT
jgi:hypothetical protein